MTVVPWHKKLHVVPRFPCCNTGKVPVQYIYLCVLFAESSLVFVLFVSFTFPAIPSAVSCCSLWHLSVILCRVHCVPVYFATFSPMFLVSLGIVFIMFISSYQNRLLPSRVIFSCFLFCPIIVCSLSFVALNPFSILTPRVLEGIFVSAIL